MTDPRIASFAETFLDAASEFIDSVPSETRRLPLGPVDVDVSVPSGGPQPALDVLEGLVRANDRADDDALGRTVYRLTLMDDRLGPRLPVGSWPSDYHFPLGIVRADKSLPYRVAIDRHTSTVSVFDPGTRRLAVWIRDFGALPYWAAATPFRLQLSWIADAFDAEFVHAAAIERNGRALLLTGPSGSGKSTMSLLAAQSGDALIGDDFVLCCGAQVSAVYTRAKMHDRGLRAPGGAGLAVVNAQAPAEKRIIDVERSAAVATAAGGMVVGIALPVIAGMSAHQRIPSGRALRMMAPASVSGLLGGTEQSLPRLRSLVSSVPCYRWALSGDFDADVAELDRLWAALDGT